MFFLAFLLCSCVFMYVWLFGVIVLLVNTRIYLPPVCMRLVGEISYSESECNNNKPPKQHKKNKKILFSLTQMRKVGCRFDYSVYIYFPLYVLLYTIRIFDFHACACNEKPNKYIYKHIFKVACCLCLCRNKAKRRNNTDYCTVSRSKLSPRLFNNVREYKKNARKVSFSSLSLRPDI